MKKIYVMLIGVLALLSPGIGNAHQLRIEIAPENVALSSEGPLLLLEGCEPIPLSNLHYEEGFCYTLYDIPLNCLCCHKSFETMPEICDCCGCDQFISDPFNAYPWLGDALVMASSGAMLKPTGGGEVDINNQGGQASVQGGVKTNDGKWELVGGVRGSKGPDGKVGGSVYVGGKVHY